MSKRASTIRHNQKHLQAFIAQQTSAATTGAPAGFEATCPKCAAASNAAIITSLGHCLACQRDAFAVRVAEATR